MPIEQTPFNDQALSQWHAKGQFIKLCGHSVFVIDESERATQDLPVILMIHGFPTSSWDWEPIWESLLKHYRLVCLDMLGFGFSDKPDRREYTIHRQADLVDALVSRLELNEFHLLAHDYGVSVAQELLARQLERQTSKDNEKACAFGTYLSCTFLNGGLFPETHKPLLIQKLLLGPLGKSINKLTGFSTFCKSFSKVFGADTKPTHAELAQFWEVINHNNGRHVFHNLITYMNDRLEHRERWVTALQKATIPLAVINGSVDPVSGKHLVMRYKQLKCRLDYLYEMSEIGHYPHVEAPKRVTTSLLNFLAKIEPRQTPE